jgi:hypothetical protein
LPPCPEPRNLVIENVKNNVAVARWYCILLKSISFIVFHLQKGEVIQFVKIRVLSNMASAKRKGSVTYEVGHTT